MRKHHVLAGALAAVTVAALVVDTAVLAVTGQRTVVTDDSRGSDASVLAVGTVLGILFLAMGLVVRRESPRFADARRAARVARPFLMGGLFLLGAGCLTVYPLQTLSGLAEDSTAIKVSGLVALLALTATFVAAFVTGLALVGRNPLGIGGRVLALMGPVIVATVLLVLVVPTLASPVYCTAVVIVGVSLLGVRAEPVGASSESRVAVKSPASMA